MYEFDFYLVWTGALIAVAVCVALAVVSARVRIPLLGAVTVLPVALGLVLATLGFSFHPPHPVYASLLAIELFALGVAAGGPITLFVVGLAESFSVRAGRHGGIVPAPAPVSPGPQDTGGQAVAEAVGREVLRGGATIGYLERIAVIGCIAVGRFEGIAVIVAIKGLGRFSELDSPEARERFIIGTLTSLVWACASGALILLVASPPL
jgi:hypothetical protein